MTPVARLRAVLKAARPETHDTIKAEIEYRLFRRAILGQPVNASAHLQLCGLIGVDPVTGEARAVDHIGDFHWPSLASAIRMRRIVLRVRRKPAAKLIGVAYPTLCRIEYGEPVSIEAVLAVCAFLERHPYDFCSPYVARETSETQRSAA